MRLAVFQAGPTVLFLDLKPLLGRETAARSPRLAVLANRFQ